MVDEKRSLTEENQASLNGYEQNKQVSNNITLSDIHNAMKAPLIHIDRADPTKIQCVAGASLELNEMYHKVILQQAKMSFRFAIIETV